MENIITTTVDLRDTKALSDKIEEALAIQSYFDIPDETTYLNAVDYLSSLKKCLKNWEGVRKTMTKPLDESKKSIMSFFNEPKSRMTEREGLVKKSILVYMNKKEEEARVKAAEEKAKLREEAKTAKEWGDEEEAKELVVEAAKVEVQDHSKGTSGISYREKWYAEVVDFDKVPDEFKFVDMAKLNKLATQYKDVTDRDTMIPGVIFKSERIVVSG